MVFFGLWSPFRGPVFSFFIYKSEFFWYRCFIQMLYCEGFSFYNVSWKGTAVLSCGTFSIWPILCSPATVYEMFMRHGGTCQNKCAYNSATNWYSMPFSEEICISACLLMRWHSAVFAQSETCSWLMLNSVFIAPGAWPGSGYVSFSSSVSCHNRKNTMMALTLPARGVCLR